MRTRLDPAVAAVRRAVRGCLVDLGAGELVLVGCSGGADSLALSAASAFESRRTGLRAGAVVVDHGLQPGSAGVAGEVAEQLRLLGLDPVVVVPVQVAADAAGGPEAAARSARYAAFESEVQRLGAATLLLGHTRDDQAETVLLGLARGSGARSLAGMRPRSGHYRRPLLQLSREVTRAACAAEQLVVWEDPHNADLAYARVRVRRRVLPVLEAELGPGVSAALARTADLLAADADALDAWAEREAGAGMEGQGLPADRLAALPQAVRWRVLRRAALAAGCPATDLTAGHVEALDALVTDWHGQRGVDLPGPVRAARRGGEVGFEKPAVAG